MEHALLLIKPSYRPGSDVIPSCVLLRPTGNNANTVKPAQHYYVNWSISRRVEALHYYFFPQKGTL